MRLSIISYNGYNINDGTYFQAFFPDDMPMSIAASPIEISALNSLPGYAGKQLSGFSFPIDIKLNGTIASQKETVKSWFDTSDKTLRKLLVKDTANGDKQYFIMATALSIPQMEGQSMRVIMYTNDPIWQTETLTSTTWAVATSGGTKALTVGGNAPALPVIKITPDTQKSPVSGYQYSRFVSVRVPYIGRQHVHSEYMIDITNGGWDTAALVTASKMLSSGDDLRVFINGVDTPRWLGGMNTLSTKVWIKLPSLNYWEADLDTSIALSGVISTIIWKNTPLGTLPNSGIVQIDNEIFTYSGKSEGEKKLTGVSRAAKGSSMASHSTSAKIYLLPSDVTIKYGNSAAGSPPNAGSVAIAPKFSLTSSTNTSWVYANFSYGSNYTTFDGVACGWKRGNTAFSYTGVQNTFDDNVPVAGVRNSTSNPDAGGAWTTPDAPIRGFTLSGQVYAGQTSEYFTNQFQNRFRVMNVFLDSQVQYVPPPSNKNVWENWSLSYTFSSSANPPLAKNFTIGRNPGLSIYTTDTYCADITDATLTLDSSYVPAVSMVAEVGIYAMNCKITNSTTGQYIRVQHTIAVDQQLEINTASKEITYNADGTKVPGIVTPDSYTRKDWLPLSPGVTNTLVYEEDGLTNVGLVIEYRERML